MILKFPYILGGNITLTVEAEFKNVVFNPLDPEQEIGETSVEITQVYDASGLTVETQDISIGNQTLDNLLEMEAWVYKDQEKKVILNRVKIIDLAVNEKLSYWDISEMLFSEMEEMTDTELLNNLEQNHPDLMSEVEMGVQT